MRRLVFAMLLVAVATVRGYANDGVYFTSGNFLVPVKETDVAVSKEILTITVGKDGFAHVDVFYEFFNRGEEKTVTMAFEASSPYNTMEPLRREGGHPFIHDFTVMINGKQLEHTNGIVATGWVDGVHTTDFTPLDAAKWKGYGEVADSILPYEDAVYNQELDSLTSFAYAYYFPARFQHGKNIVHHTYRYRMSYNVACSFEIPYRLTPATRWANGQVDDFTLRVKSDAPVGLCLVDSMFRDAPFVITEGKGFVIPVSMKYQGHYLFADLAGGATLEWHSKNFRPTAEMSIVSADLLTPDERWATSADVVIRENGSVSRYIGESGDNYLVAVQDYGLVPKAGARVVNFSAEKGNGFLFARDFGTINVRQRPSTASPKLGTIESEEGCVPDSYPCLGFEKGWYKLGYGDRVGYVREDLMRWSPVNVM